MDPRLVLAPCGRPLAREDALERQEPHPHAAEIHVDCVCDLGVEPADPRRAQDDVAALIPTSM